MGSDQQQHFCLRWNNFHSNIASSFETLRDHEEFVDVTLACEGHSLKAHKVVLSACSPYFKNLLRQNPCQHPIIILRDVAFHDLSALLSFVYQGEVYVSQERLPAFLRTAEMLHIKGLTEQHHNHALHRGSSFSLGPLPTSATVNSNHEHLQGMLSSRVNSVGSASSPPLSPSTRQNSSHPPSPLPKKRRSVSGTLGVSGSSPPGGISTSSIMAAPTSSTPPHREGLPNSDHENHVGIPLRLRDSPSLSAVLTQPISTAHSSHSDLVVTPLAVNSRPPPLKALTNATSSTHTSPDAAGGVNIKLEATDVKQENSQNSSPDEAVNLVTEGSILRQRIQGLRASPDSPYFPSSRAPSSHEESSMDERFSGQELRSEYDRDSRFDFERDGRYEFERDGRGADYDRETTFTDHDKEMYHSGSPMLIRSPLAGLLPRDAPGLFGSAGTSASLTHQGDSSQDAEYLVRACVPKLWNSRQPGICPICNRVFSNKFNLKQHIINIHTKSEGIECDLCHKKCKNKWYLRRHQVTHHGAPLKRNRSFPVVDHHFVNDENDRCQREKQQQQQQQHAAAAAVGE